LLDSLIITMISKSYSIKAIKESLLASPTSEATSFQVLFRKTDLHMESLLLVARVLRMYFIQLEEKRKKDLRSQQCTTRLMELLVQENRSTETTFGQSLKLSIDLDLLKRRCQEELLCRCILRESEEFSQRQ